MRNELYCDPARRHDFVLLFDVQDGNPNGDPDAGNQPRIDPETRQGLVTDVCIKRKVRNFVSLLHKEATPNRIYIQNKIVLNDLHKQAYDEVEKAGKKADVDSGRQWMCQNFYDVRTFGAVMSTGEKEKSCGQVRGPVQLTFARSIDPVFPMEVSITRLAITNAKDKGDTNTMGRKTLLPYGLYRAHGYVNPLLGAETGMSDEDLALFWRALLEGWELDRSASRGAMACRGLYIFSHDSGFGRAPAHRLQERVQVQRRSGVAVPRSFGDYTVTGNGEALPDGVTLKALA